MKGEKNDNINLRYNIIVVIICIIGFILLLQLFNLQIINGNDYRAMSSARLTRETTVYADRGEILDRNGVKFVTTSTGYSLDLYKTTTNNDELNNNILKIIKVLEENGDSYVDNLIIDVNPFKFSIDNEDSIKKWKKSNGINEDYNAEQCFNYLKEKYEIKNEDVEEARKIMAIRYEITQNGYSTVRPVEIANNITKNSILKFSEENSNFSGIDIITKPVVTYNNGTY